MHGNIEIDDSSRKLRIEVSHIQLDNHVKGSVFNVIFASLKRLDKN